MVNYIKSNPVNVALSTLFVLCFGGTTFLLVTSNSDLRQKNKAIKNHNKELTKENAALQSANEELLTEVAERDTFIKITTLVYDSLKQSLIIVSTKITAVFPRHAAVIAAGIDSQIVFITKFISQSDSIKRGYGSMPEAGATENTE